MPTHPAPPPPWPPFPLQAHSPHAATVTLNGQILGAHRSPDALVRALRALRRGGRLGQFVSVARQGPDAVHIASDGGRVCRPLVVCDAATGHPRLTSAHVSRVKAGAWGFGDLLRAGVVEYLVRGGGGEGCSQEGWGAGCAPAAFRVARPAAAPPAPAQSPPQLLMHAHSLRT